jgi:hypothetical protein
VIKTAMQAARYVFGVPTLAVDGKDWFCIDLVQVALSRPNRII